MYFSNKTLKLKNSVTFCILIGFLTAILNFCEILNLKSYTLWAIFGFSISVFVLFLWIGAFSNCEKIINYLRVNLKTIFLGSPSITITTVILLLSTSTNPSVVYSALTGFLFFCIALVLINTTRFIIFVVND